MNTCKVMMLAALLLAPTATAQEEEKAMELMKAGTRLVKEEKIEEALLKFREVLDLMPDWVQVRYDLAKLAFEVGKKRYFSNIDLSARAVKARLDAGEDEAKIAEAEALETKAREEREKADALLEEARGHFEKITKSEGSHDNILDSHFTLGHIHALAGRWEEARAAYVEAKEMGPKGEVLEKIERAIALVDEEIEASRR